MKTSTVLLLGGAAFLLLFYGDLGIANNVLQYYISSVDFTGITTGKIGLVIQNPSNTAILINSMAGTVSANGTTIGNISNFQGGITINPNSQQVVTVYVAVSITAVLGTLYTMLTSPTGLNLINFVLAGNVNIAGIPAPVPFNITQSVTV